MHNEKQIKKTHSRWHLTDRTMIELMVLWTLKYWLWLYTLLKTPLRILCKIWSLQKNAHVWGILCLNVGSLHISQSSLYLSSEHPHLYPFLTHAQIFLLCKAFLSSLGRSPLAHLVTVSSALGSILTTWVFFSFTFGLPSWTIAWSFTALTNHGGDLAGK